MAAIMTRSGQASRTLLPLGTRVIFTYGVTPREGTIVEHRGPLASGGRPLYGIESNTEFHAIYIELADDEFQIKK